MLRVKPCLLCSFRGLYGCWHPGTKIITLAWWIDSFKWNSLITIPFRVQRIKQVLDLTISSVLAEHVLSCTRHMHQLFTTAHSFTHWWWSLISVFPIRSQLQFCWKHNLYIKRFFQVKWSLMIVYLPSLCSCQSLTFKQTILKIAHLCVVHVPIPFSNSKTKLLMSLHNSRYACIPCKKRPSLQGGPT